MPSHEEIQPFAVHMSSLRLWKQFPTNTCPALNIELLFADIAYFAGSSRASGLLAFAPRNCSAFPYGCADAFIYSHHVHVT